jgi:hypothetical protein
MAAVGCGALTVISTFLEPPSFLVGGRHDFGGIPWAQSAVDFLENHGVGPSRRYVLGYRLCGSCGLLAVQHQKIKKTTSIPTPPWMFTQGILFQTQPLARFAGPL